MKVHLKKVSEQIIVITGASSGIGLATARMAAQRGARLVLAARSQEALQQLTDELREAGGQAVYVAADVGNQEDVAKIANKAQEEFGGFDTWVNNAGIGIYGKLEDVTLSDMRQLFETNFWGVVYGSLESLKQLKPHGGALINIGSTLSERAIPMQGIYSASKHAIKGFTDSLRMELEEEGAPVSVTLIKPGAIDTPFTVNAKNYMEAEPTHFPPVYAPDAVASALLHCAETPVRDVFIGAGGKGNATLGYYAPRLADKYMESLVIPAMKSDKQPLPFEQNALNKPSEHLAERGNYEGHVAQSSLYTRASLHPVLTAAAFAGTGLAVGALLRALQSASSRRTKQNFLGNLRAIW
jgi:short-subunit dehydrogenase